eukprot:178072-Rhodomonas_salina.2
MRRLQEAEKTFEPVNELFCVTGYRFALKLSIIDVEVLSGYATLLWDMGKPQKACDMFQLALEREPSYIPTLLSYGVHCSKCPLCAAQSSVVRSKPVALLQFRKALELDSSNSRALLYCAVALEDLGRADTTVISELYAKSAAEDPNNVEGLHAYARFLKAKMQDYDKAQEIYEQALSIQHNDVDVLCSYGALLSERTPYEQGRFKRAETCYKLALQVEPDNVDTLYNFAVLLWAGGPRPAGARGSAAAGRGDVQEGVSLSAPALAFRHREFCLLTDCAITAGPAAPTVGCRRALLVQHVLARRAAKQPVDDIQGREIAAHSLARSVPPVIRALAARGAWLTRAVLLPGRPAAPRVVHGVRSPAAAATRGEGRAVGGRAGSESERRGGEGEGGRKHTGSQADGAKLE